MAWYIVLLIAEMHGSAHALRVSWKAIGKRDIAWLFISVTLSLMFTSGGWLEAPGRHQMLKAFQHKLPAVIALIARPTPPMITLYCATASSSLPASLEDASFPNM